MAQERRINGDQLYNGRPVPNDKMYQMEEKAQHLLSTVPISHPHRRLVEWLLQYAQILRADAGYGGAHHDGGASALENEVEAFIAGHAGRLPTCWDRVLKIRAKDADPEYAKYLELKKRFE